MKKSNVKKIILSLTMGLIMVLCAIPTTFAQLFTPAKALKSGYQTPTTVDIKGSFDDNTSTIPTGWSVEAEYENGEDKDSTSYNGLLSTNPSNWNQTYENWLNGWIEDWDKNYKYVYGDTDRVKIETALKAELPKFNTPLSPSYTVEKTEPNKILAIMSGKTFTKYLSDDESTAEINSVDRKGKVNFVSNEFTLDQYSFYRVVLYVKTTNGATAEIKLDGDIEETLFTGIQTGSTVETKYYFYQFTDGSSTKSFLSLTEPGASTLTYNDINYTYDGTEKKYTNSSHAGHSITAIKETNGVDNKFETADNSVWQKYEVLISTTTEAKLQLSLGLGNETTYSTGNVFFDDISIEKIQLLDFYTNAANTSSSKFIDKREILSPNNTNSRNYTILENFETEHNWYLSNASLDETDLSLVDETNVTGFNETFPKVGTSTNKVLKVNNHGAKEVVVKSDKITLEKMRYYRVSFWATSLTSSSKLTVELIGTNASEKTSTTKDTTSPFISGRTNDKPSNVNNFWVNYIFYVKAPSEVSTTAEFKLTIPSGSIVYFDNMVIETVSKSEYSASKNNKQDLSTTFEDQIIGNGNFYEHDNVDVEYYNLPLPPTSWSNIIERDVYEYYEDATDKLFTSSYLEEDLTFSEDKKTITLNGKNFVKADDAKVYNYKDGDKIIEKIMLIEDVKLGYRAHKQAYTNDAYDDIKVDTNLVAGIVQGTSKDSNILSLNVPTTESAESATYTSPVMKLSSTGAVYIIRVDVKTDATAYTNLKLTDKDEHVYASLSSINTYNNSTHTSEWKTFTFYVGTGLQTIELYLDLEYDNCVGTVEFKKIEAIKTTTTTIMDSKLNQNHEELANAGIAVVNLQKETFIEHSNELNTNTHLFDTNLYKQTEIKDKTSGIYGVLDTTNPSVEYNGITSKDSEISPYVLVIKNDANESTKLEAMKKFTVAKSKFLKITIIARAEGLTAGKTATISFGALNKTFNINSSEYTEYVLYVDNSNSDVATTVQYELALLDSAGTFIIDSISIESPSSISSVQSEYPDGDTDTVKFATIGAPDEKEEDKEDDDATELEIEDKTLEIFFAVFASLLLVAAIVFAIVFTRYKALRKPRRKAERSKVKETDDGQKGFI